MQQGDQSPQRQHAPGVCGQLQRHSLGLLWAARGPAYATCPELIPPCTPGRPATCQVVHALVLQKGGDALVHRHQCPVLLGDQISKPAGSGRGAVVRRLRAMPGCARVTAALPLATAARSPAQATDVFSRCAFEHAMRHAAAAGRAGRAPLVGNLVADDADALKQPVGAVGGLHGRVGGRATLGGDGQSAGLNRQAISDARGSTSAALWQSRELLFCTPAAAPRPRCSHACRHQHTNSGSLLVQCRHAAQSAEQQLLLTVSSHVLLRAAAVPACQSPLCAAACCRSPCCSPGCTGNAARQTAAGPSSAAHRAPGGVEASIYNAPLWGFCHAAAGPGMATHPRAPGLAAS